MLQNTELWSSFETFLLQVIENEIQTKSLRVNKFFYLFHTN